MLGQRVGRVFPLFHLLWLLPVSRASQDYLGSYRLLNVVRSGKTCDVWEGIKDGTGERFALKVLAGEYADNKDEVGFLKHEIKPPRRKPCCISGVVR